MNDLSLRLAAVKLSAQPKRLSEMSETIVKLPSKWKNSQSEYVLKFAAAANLSQQMLIVKNIFTHSESLTFLADLLFASPLRHPIRNVLNRLFSSKENIKNGEPTHPKESLINALREALRYLASTITNFESSTVTAEHVNNVLVSVTGCLQNFAYGRDALAHEIQAFIPIKAKALNLYWTTINGDQREDLSPTGRNEYYMYIQTLLRFYVNSMTEYKLDMESEHWQDMRTINSLATMVAVNTDIPWDVRSIAGLSIGHNARINNQFGDYLTKCEDIERFEELPIKAAALLVLKKNDYNLYGPQALQILKLVLNETESNRNISNMLVYMCKHLHTYSKSLSHIKLTPNSAIYYKKILVDLVRFSIEHIISLIDTIRHMCANIIRQVLQHSKVVGEPQVMAELYANYNVPGIPISAACLMLQQIVEVYGSEEVVKSCPKLYDLLFYKHLGREESVNSLFKCMMTMAHKEKSFPDQSSAWCKHIVIAASQYNSQAKGIEDLIDTAVRLEPHIVNLLIDDRSVPLIAKLMTMCVARRNNLPVKKIHTYIRLATVNNKEDLRLTAIIFIVDTPRMSEPFSEFDLKLIITFLDHNANNPKAHFRQRTYAIMQKMCKRLELNLAQLQRDPKSCKEDTDLNEFVNELFRLLSLNLFYTANYGRRWLSMRMLRDLINMMERLGQPWRDRLPSQVLPYLENCLADSYEHNKEFAVHLLGKLQKCSTFKPELMLQKLMSVRPPESATGAYQLIAYCQAANVKFPLEQPDTVLPNSYRRYYLALDQCLSNLHTGVLIASDDLLVASQVNPLYGLLAATRLLLQRLDMKQLTEEQLWRFYFERLLHVCWGVVDLMLPIVGSEAPEGQMPAPAAGAVKLLLEPEMQAEELAVDEAEEEATNGIAEPIVDNSKKQHKYEQVVLLCAWRSIKEVSLLLGDLSERAPIEPENQRRYLLSRKDWATIGDRFVQLLGEVKHRGAFEQAYAGFAQYVYRYWRSEATELNRQPPIWLEDTLRLPYGKGGFVACQAIICAELKLGTNKMFTQTMNTLLTDCENRDGGEKAIIARTHAFNIMRCLFRCSELGNLVDEYVGRGIKCAFDSLASGNYAECNAASLMLSALMIRIFGVERARAFDGELHRRNRMTGRIFFTCYPKLFDYLHDALAKAAEHVSKTKGGQTLQLEAILLLLSRLYPSNMEGAESSLNLDMFVPFLSQICYVHDKMSRRRACKVLTNFLNPDEALTHLRNLCMALCTLKKFLEQENPTWDNNAVHGHMGLALELVRIVRWKDINVTHSLTVVLSAIAVQLYTNGGDIFLFKDIIIVIVDIIQDSAKSEYYDMDLITALIGVYQLDHKEIYNRCVEAGISTNFYLLFVLHLQRLTVRTENILPHMTKMVVDPDPDTLPAHMHQFKIELFLYILMQLNNEGNLRFFSSCEMKYFKFPLTLRIYYKSLTTEQRTILAAQICESDALRQHVVALATQVERGSKWCPEMQSSLYTLMAFLSKFDLTIEELLNLKMIINDAEPGMAICILRQLNDNSINTWENIQPICLRLLRYVVAISAPTQNIYLRWKAANLVDRICKHSVDILHSKDVQLIGTFVRVCLQLLVDESDMVRNETSEIVTTCTVSIMKSGEPAANVDEHYGFLPLVAESCFTTTVLRNMQMYKRDDDFLIELFNIIVSPFVGEVLENRRVKDKPKNSTDATELEDDDTNVFDKHEVNLYCEGMRVLLGVAKAFKSEFPSNKQLMETVNAVMSMCDP